jgi:23S rRNA pseudouridine1911/1915/1917 synthase
MLFADNMKVKVLFENEDVLVLDKPAGISVHGDGKRAEYTIAEYVAENFPQVVGVGEDVTLNGVEVKRPGIVHRLDKDTSGCLIIAKNQKSYNNLKQQFQEHLIKKEYVALVHGWLKNESGIIDLPLARSRADFRKQTTAIHRKGGDEHRGEERAAVTRYKVLERKVLKLVDENGKEKEVKVSLATFFPLSGRMHQIRVHSSSIGHSIVGDNLYGRKDVDLEKIIFGSEKPRQLLHAHKVTFTNLDGNQTTANSPLPKEFAQ